MDENNQAVESEVKEVVTATDAQETATDDTQSVKEEKTFTQKELDDIIKARVKKEKDVIKDLKEKADKFDELEKEKLTELEKANLEKEELKTRLAEAEKVKQKAELKAECSVNGVKGDVVNDFMVILNNYLCEEKTPSETIKEVLEIHPYFKVNNVSLEGATGKSSNNNELLQREHWKKMLK